MFWNRKKKKQQEDDGEMHVYPTISVTLKNNIERLSFILDKPMQDVASELYMYGMDQREVIEIFAPHFVGSNLQYEKSVFYCNEKNKRVDQTIQGPTERITVRLNDQPTIDNVILFEGLLDVTQAKAVALVVDKAIRHPSIIEALMQEFNSRNSFDDMVAKELKKLMAFINKDNPFKNVKWNDKLMELVFPKPKIKNLTRKISKEAIDRETYRWGREIEELYRAELKNDKKKKAK